MHFLGINGMPRRIPDFADQFSFLNVIASFGAILSVIALVFFIYVFFLAYYFSDFNFDFSV